MCILWNQRNTNLCSAGLLQKALLKAEDIYLPHQIQKTTVLLILHTHLYAPSNYCLIRRYANRSHYKIIFTISDNNKR